MLVYNLLSVIPQVEVLQEKLLALYVPANQANVAYPHFLPRIAAYRYCTFQETTVHSGRTSDVKPGSEINTCHLPDADKLMAVAGRIVRPPTTLVKMFCFFVVPGYIFSV